VALQVERLNIPDVVLITPAKFTDSRGFFAETYSQARLLEAGIDCSFVQDNQSYSEIKGTIRGLHCQLAPRAQGKLVRVISGAIWDVAVDARSDSPTYGQFAAATLSAANFAQLWIPPGFLHGFCTLEPHTEIVYKVTDRYDRETERGVIWNDAELALPWPVAAAEALLSDKDSALPAWSAAAGWFAA
jgi:dTDP-4-dehydrorhamnose 3,5-epimerase